MSASDPAGPEQTAARRKRQEGPFRLPGRPELEKFFAERILDVIDRDEAYRRMVDLQKLEEGGEINA